MTIKIIWVLVCINTLAWLGFIGAYLVSAGGRNPDSMEKGWTMLIACLGLLVILLAAVPLRFSQSGFAVAFAGFFAVLPAAVSIGLALSNKLPALKEKESFAATYYKDKTQRSIAAAIEQNDTTRLKELIKGQDLNIQGNRVWDWDGLNYLQFAIRLRSNPVSFPFDEQANTAAIRILIENGSATSPALVEGVKYLPAKTLSLLLDKGADPNIKSYYDGEPLLFGTIDASGAQNDKAILLVQKGADVNAKNSSGFTPVMYAASRAQTSESWSDAWRVVHFLLAEANADYTYTTKDGSNLQNIIRNIRQDATANKIAMPPDFLRVVKWLEQHHIDTDPTGK
ncbi:MAG: hypothetical protein INR73_13425 [Williamsia sp.]|nr:hypothetical protein [Williamsia sp.]